MLTVKRLYLYGVLGVALVLWLVGLTDLIRLVVEGLADAAGVRALGGAALAREELSWALALVVVAVPIWSLHAWLLQRSMRGSEAAASDERASSARATFFFLVLVVTLSVAGWYLVELCSAVIRLISSGAEPWGVAGSMAGAAVVGSAWLLHLLWRGRDLSAEPLRTAGDWLTRLYVYGVLFVVAFLALIATANVLTTLSRQILDVRPLLESAAWWREAIVTPVALMVVAATGWLFHWRLSARLMQAAPPMGEAHRDSRTRTGYLLGVVLLCAVAVLLLGTMSLRHIFAELIGVWRSSEGSRLIEDVGGPIVMLAPFLVAWWWHRRRATREAFDLGGPARALAVTRSGRYVVAVVGLAGLAIGSAWVLQTILDLAGGVDSEFARSALLRDGGTPALAAALVGLATWTPAWLLSVRDRAQDPIGVAIATSRRAYLLLVSGLAVVAVMGSLAYLVYQVMRMLLDAGSLGDTSWAISILAVASVVLTYHLIALRTDIRLASTAEVQEPGVPAVPGIQVTGATEVLELSGPAGTDFETVNATIRARLPEGLSLRVVAAAKHGG